MPKSYLGTFLLGRHSPTEDIEGEITLLENPPVPSLEQIASAAQSLVGRIRQRPPAFSALKVAGKRAYDLARRGETVELEARPVDVHAIEVARYEYPELVLRIDCGGGTYVRSLGRDLAQSLGTEAVMSALVRTAIGDFKIDAALDPRQLTAENWRERLQPMVRAVPALAQVVLSKMQIENIHNGIAIRPPASIAEGQSELAAIDESGRLVAIVGPRADGLLTPLRNLPSED
jgi:tRNA pseudouridine55 synthase